MSGSFLCNSALIYLFIYSLRPGLSFDTGTDQPHGNLACEPRVSLLSVGSLLYMGTCGFLCGGVDLNLGVHSSSASFLLTELCPKPQTLKQDDCEICTRPENKNYKN